MKKKRIFTAEQIEHRKQYNREYYKKNREKLIQKQKEYYEGVKIRDNRDSYYTRNKQKIREYFKEYYKKNKHTKFAEYTKIRLETGKYKQYYHNYNKIYYMNNKERFREYYKQYHKHYYQARKVLLKTQIQKQNKPKLVFIRKLSKNRFLFPKKCKVKKIKKVMIQKSPDTTRTTVGEKMKKMQKFKIEDEEILEDVDK